MYCWQTIKLNNVLHLKDKKKLFHTYRLLTKKIYTGWARIKSENPGQPKCSQIADM